MKKNVIKFTLTLAAASVLAACGSSSGGNNNAAAEQAAAAQTAAAEKAAAEQAAAEQAAAEQAAAEAEKAVAATKRVGAKFVKKTESNLNVGEGTVTNSKSSTSVSSMTLDLHPSLDTIVVAQPLDKDGNVISGAKQAYLEDFDFRGNTDNTVGTHTLTHIYKTADGSTKVGDARGLTSETKTDTKGQDSGKAYVYEEGRLNYTSKKEGYDVGDQRVARTDAELAGSVAEVYGAKTFRAGDSAAANNAPFADVNVNNAPFTSLGTVVEFDPTTGAVSREVYKGYVDGSKLNYVQYGRVTSKLHNVTENSLKAGKNIGADGTVVASFGGYGEKGTEDSYFYRGTNDTAYNAALATNLKNTYFGNEATGGTLNYRGHAVTYNLDRDYAAAAGVPNAIGYEQQLISGTHVNANIDLASKAVTGNLYNVWEAGVEGKKSIQNVELANFSGSLANNGSITGTSTRTVDAAAGTFNANLFGEKAEELGGAIASTDTSNNWGAAFGAKLQNTPFTEAKQVSWGESTDQNNVNNPLK